MRFLGISNILPEYVPSQAFPCSVLTKYLAALALYLGKINGHLTEHQIVDWH